MTKTAPRLLVLLAGLGLAASTAWAATHHVPAKIRQVAAAEKQPVGEVWNWARIDTNKDNLIEPTEMENFLSSHRTQPKKTG
jgi:hypothetical protein